MPAVLKARKTYYSDDSAAVHHGDCLVKMEHIADGSIDMVMTDPPFGRTKCRWDSVIPLGRMWRALRRIVKPNGAIVLMAQTPFDKVLGASNLPMLRYEWIWHKNKASGHLNAKRMPMKAHENILVFYDRLPMYNPQRSVGHAPVNSATRRGSSDLYGGQAGATRFKGGATTRCPRSVIDAPVINNDRSGELREHPTQKPVALMEYLIQTYTSVGDTVLDFALGSGTTLVAAKRLGRCGIGIEKDEKYCAVAARRLREATS